MDEKPISILRAAVEEIYEKYGIKISDASFTWINTSTANKVHYIFNSVTISAEMN